MMNSIRNVDGEFPPPAEPSMDVIADAVLSDAIARKSADVRNTEMVKELIARFNGGDRLKDYNAIANEHRALFLVELAKLGALPAATIEIINQVTTLTSLLLAGFGFIVSAILVVSWLNAQPPHGPLLGGKCYPASPYMRPDYRGGGVYIGPTSCMMPDYSVYPADHPAITPRPAINPLLPISPFIPFLVAGTLGFGAVWLLRKNTRVLAYLIYLVRHATALQRGLARLWVAVSVGWLMHSLWWIFAHCHGWVGQCVNTLDLWGYVLTTPMAMLIATLAAYWVIRGFRPRAS